VQTVSALPHPQSDVAVAATGGTAYVVGGYDGTNWLNTILAWRPGSAVRVAGHLPVGLRYAAATAVGDHILIMGGSTPTGASDAVYRFDPATGQVRQIGRLPQPTTHASAATLGGFAYLVGGRGDNLGTQTSTVWSIDPRTGAVQSAGKLPQPLSDTASLSINGAIVVAGGLAPTTTVADVGELVPQSAQ
jgi:N-acetylneuraminic acid mutarotase